MINKSLSHNWIVKSLAAGTLMLGMSVTQLASAAQITINLEDQNANPVSGFRYLVEEDTMYKPVPGVQDLTSLSFGFHRSHTPVAVGDDGKGIAGSTAGTSAVVTVPDNKTYFVSIVPYVGHALSGIDVAVGTGNVDKKVIVNTFPIPTSQISIRVFEDSNPVNGAIDLDERFLSHTIIDGQKVPFEIRLFDPAGQYGAAGGLVSHDAYGNPLGTEYDNLGNIISTPDTTNGFVLTPDANGYLVVKNLPPAKYGIEVTPPRGSDPNHPLWIQTSTIEGTRTIDAWVKANNPEQFVEFGPPGPHVFVGFVRNFDCVSGDHGMLDTYVDSAGNTQTNDACAGQPSVTGGATIHGQIVDNHLSRPGPLPDPNTGQGGGFQFANGTPFEGCRVAVNIGIAGKTIYSQKCGDEATFEIDNLMPGSYSLSIWDDGLDAVIANHPFTVSGNETDGYQVSALLQNPLSNVNGTQASNIDCDTMGCDLGQIPVFNWFHKINTVMFFDRNENGYRDCVTLTCDDPAQDDVTMHADSTGTNLRFRDGRIYKAVPVDVFGEAPHDETFPFFHWLVAEVDFAKYKATGATIVVDNGGYDVNLKDNGYVPQPQVGIPDCMLGAGGKGVVTSPCTWDGGVSKTETGTVLTEAFQGFLGQKNVIQFGKSNYADGENGGITGVVVYAITRAEDDPRFAAAEEWEPGIPRVQVALYQDAVDTTGAAVVGGDKIIDDINGEPGIQLADVDNYPLGWSKDATGTVAPGREDIDRNGNGLFDKGDAMEVAWTDSWDDNLPTGCLGANNLPGLADDLCFDGLRNWNQIRPGVFDGGYAFSENLPAGMYIVQSFTPPGYTLLKEEDKNVDFGDEYAVPQALPPICVGNDHVVPALLSHVMDKGAQVVPGDPADYAAPYAGQTRKLCDTKQVRVADGKNAAADFHYFTQVPKAAMVVGGILNDLANEFNPNSPAFGEKFAPPWLPIAFYDFKGHEITRVYSDQFGKYNALLPSTNTVNIGSPSGVAPSMITACMNDAGLVDNPDYSVGSNLPQRIPDPNHNPQYSQFCYTLQYMPGGTTYLDTPVLPISAFAGAGKQLDCEAGDTTPLISSVTSSDSMAGPYVADQNAALETDRMLTIRSTGIRSVLNPSSDELGNKFITRDYGFGSLEGSVQLVDEQGNSNVMSVDSWSNLVITAPVPMGIADGRYQLMVTNHDSGLTSPMGVTVTVGPLPQAGAIVREVIPSNVAGATPIQDALDAANPGDLILVAAGRYDEIPIMYKPVHLQGAGAYSTFINARSVPSEKVQGWRNKILDLLNVKHAFSLIPGQETAELFTTEEGAGLTVVGKSFGNTKFTNGRPSGIDGFTITGASTGGGVFLNGYIQGFSISNNQITGNQGTYGGGIRLGHNTIKEEVVNDANRQFRHPDARNRNIRIHHNMITRNGVFNGAGGGIAIYTGARNYRVTNNLICGNFAATDGAGIGHLGLSSGGRIEDNTIIFNQSFRQTPGFETDGGGILVAGADNFNGTPLSAGSGSVRIDRNLIQGNQAGAGDGAGIALRRVNGDDVADNDNKPNKWWLINVRNNTIVNNVAGNAGGGISLLDAVRVNIINNTISNNESTATAGSAFQPGSPSRSSEQVAGIVSRVHESVAGLLKPEDKDKSRYDYPFSNPLIKNNIILHNRSRIYDLASNSLIDPVTGSVSYNDLGIVPSTVGVLLDPRFCLLTDATGYRLNNIDGSTPDAEFVNSYTNGNPGLNPARAEFQTILVAPALDEGGNWLDVRYAPLSINDVDGMDNAIEIPSDYHLKNAATLSINAGNGNRGGAPNLDIDGESNFGTVDIGSDEVQ